ncbi:hypothetical protein Ac2012v2_003390 [Leucoagaricus gongylophorus]
MNPTFVSPDDVHKLAPFKLNISVYLGTSRLQGFHFIFKTHHSFLKMKDDCHVSSSIPLPSSIRRRAKRTLSRIKYLSQNHWSPFIQRSVSSSGRSSPRSYPSSILSPSCASLSPPSSQNSVPERFLKPLTLSRPAPTIQVASLLADPQSRSYHLEIVQHPQRTAEFGHSSLSRLPITPPIIARLTVRDPSGNSVVPEAELPFLIAHLSLFSEDGLTALNIGYETTLPILYGNLVSSIDQFEDTQGNLGLFFLFPDVSIRWRGRYQLGVTLARLSGTDSLGVIRLAGQATVLAETRTRSFDVLALSQYTAVPPTRLTQCFIRQGARLSAYMPPMAGSMQR